MKDFLCVYRLEKFPPFVSKIRGHFFSKRFLLFTLSRKSMVHWKMTKYLKGNYNWRHTHFLLVAMIIGGRVLQVFQTNAIMAKTSSIIFAKHVGEF